MSATKWNSCVVITVDRHFLPIACGVCVCVYVGSQRCADQELFFFFVFTKSLSSSCFATLVIIVDWLINRCGTVTDSDGR